MPEDASEFDPNFAEPKSLFNNQILRESLKKRGKHYD
jgi:hypothetical protein